MTCRPQGAHVLGRPQRRRAGCDGLGSQAIWRPGTIGEPLLVPMPLKCTPSPGTHAVKTRDSAIALKGQLIVQASRLTPSERSWAGLGQWVRPVLMLGGVMDSQMRLTRNAPWYLPMPSFSSVVLCCRGIPRPMLGAREKSIHRTIATFHHCDGILNRLTSFASVASWACLIILNR